MSWTCPNCGKTYHKANQYHICEEAEIDEVFRYDATCIGLYLLLLERLEHLELMKTRVSKKSVTLVVSTAFALVYARRKAIDIGIFLNQELDSPRFHKIQQYSTNRYLHWVRIKEAEDLDEDILGCIQQAYNLKI